MLCRVAGLPLLSSYVATAPSHQLDSAYVVAYLGPETGSMLSNTFNAHREEKPRRERLFRGLSRIMLSLAGIPQARIGPFQFHDNGTVTLANRPLSCSVMILDNDGAARTMSRDEAFGCTDAFVSDMLIFHDNRLLSQPNAVYSGDDCRAQMAVKTLLRVLSHRHVRRYLRSGPFALQLTDLHASNIFVDEEWNVTGLVDLEWICALPLESGDAPGAVLDDRLRRRRYPGRRTVTL